MRSPKATFALIMIVTLGAVSCRPGAAELPRRVAPPGYPPLRAEQGDAAAFAQIPSEELARALAGRRYRVRYGTLPARCLDCPVDARSGSYPEPSEGPFEQEIQVAASDVVVRIASDDGRSERRRTIACIDLRPSISVAAGRREIVLDVQPEGDNPPMPLAVDAVTGERLPVDASTLLDENNGPCDTRLRARTFWDENLRRWHMRSAPQPR